MTLRQSSNYLSMYTSMSSVIKHEKNISTLPYLCHQSGAFSALKKVSLSQHHGPVDQEPEQSKQTAILIAFLDFTIYQSKISLELGAEQGGNTLAFLFFVFNFHLRIYLERGREKHLCERKTWICCLPYTPQLGVELTTFWEDIQQLSPNGQWPKQHL